MLKRKKGLKRGGSLKRTPLKKVSEKKKLEKQLEIDQRYNDNIFYLKIWKKRKHECKNCRKHLGHEPLTLYFHHILEKRNFPEFRYEEWNIIILCWECHTNADGGRIESINRIRSYLLNKYKKGA